MKIFLLVATAAVSLALAAPAEAASKKHKKSVKRAHTGSVYSISARHPGSNDVYVGGEYIGRDPDPFIRLMMRQHPKPWDGPE